MSIEAFIKEANSTFPEVVCRSALKNVDVKKRKIWNGEEWMAMPPDDGYDKAFFLFLEDTSQTFENVMRRVKISPYVFYEKLLSCGYSPAFEDWHLFKKERNTNLYLKAISNLGQKQCAQ